MNGGLRVIREKAWIFPPNVLYFFKWETPVTWQIQLNKELKGNSWLKRNVLPGISNACQKLMRLKCCKEPGKVSDESNPCPAVFQKKKIKVSAKSMTNPAITKRACTSSLSIMCRIFLITWFFFFFYSFRNQVFQEWVSGYSERIVDKMRMMQK